MNLLFTTYQGHNEGSTQSIMFLCKGLSERGHTVYLGCRKESHIYQKMENTSVHLIPMTFNGKFDRDNMRHIRDVVRDKKIDLINAQASKDRYTTIFAKWLYGLEAKLVHTRRQKPESAGIWMQNWLYTKKTDKIVAVSNGVRDGLVKLGIDKKHIEVIYNGTPTAKYTAVSKSLAKDLRKKFGIEEHDFVIGCVSRKKKQIQLIRALTHVQFPVKVIFLGINELEEFQKIRSNYSAEHEVFFEGSIPPENVLPHFSLFDIKVLASTMEGLSQSLLESMAMGVPVIATAASGNLDLIRHQENGLLFEDGDIKGLARGIEDLHHDRHLKNRLIANGKKTALEDFNIENTISNYEHFFRSLVESNGV